MGIGWACCGVLGGCVLLTQWFVLCAPVGVGTCKGVCGVEPGSSFAYVLPASCIGVLYAKHR